MTTTPAKQALPARRPGRPYGSMSKVNGRKVLFGKQDKGQWHQGKYELQPGVSMVCLAAVDKETGHAQRGVHTFYRLTPVIATLFTRRRVGEGTLSSPRLPLPRSHPTHNPRQSRLPASSPALTPFRL